MLPLVRWTIGSTSPAGYECLQRSIESFLKYFPAEIVICHNCPQESIMKVCFRDKNYQFFNQHSLTHNKIPPIGVAWKLYPPRLDLQRKELVIDNDIVFEESIPEIEYFLNNDCTLLLEGETRNYGRFDLHVPPGYEINSGIYGMPPNFDLHKYINFYCGNQWELNAIGEYKASGTFDEQGLVALALLNYHKFVIIPRTSVTCCERELIMGKGMHFIGLNRRTFHHPFALYRSLNTKIHL